MEELADPRTQYVVLSRHCAELYDEMVALFAPWPDIEVIVDRRRKRRGAQQIPGREMRHGMERRPVAGRA